MADVLKNEKMTLREVNQFHQENASRGLRTVLYDGSILVAHQPAKGSSATQTYYDGVLAKEFLQKQKSKDDLQKRLRRKLLERKKLLK